MTKEECLKALYNLDLMTSYFCDEVECDKCPFKKGIENFYCDGDRFTETLEQLINEHFDNPPLNFEELEVGKWIWDNKYKTYVEIYDINVEIKRFNEWADLDDYGECVDYGYLEYEEGRYYRYEVKE